MSHDIPSGDEVLMKIKIKVRNTIVMWNRNKV